MRVIRHYTHPPYEHCQLGATTFEEHQTIEIIVSFDNKQIYVQLTR